VPHGNNPEIRKLFGAEIPVWLRRHNGDSTVQHGIQMLSKEFGKLHFLPQNDVKVVRTVDLAYSFNNLSVSTS
jgi:hypothetical protein